MKFVFCLRALLTVIMVINLKVAAQAQKPKIPGCKFSTGLVVLSRTCSTQIVPIVKGVVHFNEIVNFGIGSRDLTLYMKELMAERGYSFSNSLADLKTVTDIREKLCYVAIDFQEEIETSQTSSTLEKSYTLPNGEVITVGYERFQVPETYFQPSLMEKTFPGIQVHINQAIMKFDSATRKELFANIMLAGKSVTLPGMPKRLVKELRKMAPNAKIVVAPIVTKSVWSTDALEILPGYQSQ